MAGMRARANRKLGVPDVKLPYHALVRGRGVYESFEWDSERIVGDSVQRFAPLSLVRVARIPLRAQARRSNQRVDDYTLKWISFRITELPTNHSPPHRCV